MDILGNGIETHIAMIYFRNFPLWKTNPYHFVIWLGLPAVRD